MTNVEETVELIDAAIEYIQPPTRGQKYQHGPRLVSFLKRASLHALAQQETVVAERLSHFADYAAGTIPLSLLETYYDPSARASGNELARLLIKEGTRRVADGLDAFIAERPDAGLDEIRHWVHGLATAVDHLVIGSGQGGITLPRGGHDHLIFLSKVEIALKDLPFHGPELDELLAQPHARTLAHLVEVASRRRILTELRQVVSDPASTEHDIHRCLRGNYWMFGGHYVRELGVRGLTPNAVLDIPLLRGDGALHVVELKQANVPRLLGRYGGQIRTGGAVHRAVSQVQNYLRAIDENHANILDTYGIDSHRAFGTVVIGHTGFVGSGFSAGDVSQTIRTYNSHLSRIEVVTYDALLDSAERALILGSEPA